MQTACVFQAGRDGEAGKGLAGALALILAAGALLAVGVALGQNSGAHGDASLAARIQVLEDKEAIRDLLLEYGRTLDARDLKGYANLFAQDGVWVGGYGTSEKGPEGVLAMMEKNLGPNPTATYHLMSNFVIDVSGDTATAWSRWAFITKNGEEPKFTYGGHYEDELVREDGKWKFLKRTAFTDIPHFDPNESQ